MDDPRLTLLSLPNEILRCILAYAASVNTFVQIEQTCQSLRKVLTSSRNQDLWLLTMRKNKPVTGIEDNRIKDTRELAMIRRGLKNVIRHQREKPFDVFYHVFGLEGLQALYKLTTDRFEDVCKCTTLHIRGDASATICCIIEAFLCNELKLANDIMCHRVGFLSNETTYPCLSITDVRFVQNMCADGFGDCGNSFFRETTSPETDIDLNLILYRIDVCDTISRQQRTKACRRMLHAAGVAKADSAVFDFVWRSIVFTFISFMRNLKTVVLSEQCRTKITRKRRKLSSSEMMRCIAPFPSVATTSKGVIVKPVPRQAERAAEITFGQMPCRSHGGIWHAFDGETRQRAATLAEADYNISDDDALLLDELEEDALLDVSHLEDCWYDVDDTNVETAQSKDQQRSSIMAENEDLSTDLSSMSSCSW